MAGDSDWIKGSDRGLESRLDAGWDRCGARQMNGAMAVIRSRRDGWIGRSSVRWAEIRTESRLAGNRGG